MLLELRVVDLGIVEEITIGFGSGLTAITGETGAGKTLLVEALELLLGSRADPALVRAGAPEARVEGRFLADDGDEHVLVRVLPADGRSRAYLDGSLATAGELATVGATLVDLHGQHAHQRLLTPAVQRSTLDDFAGQAATDALAELRAARGDARGARAELAELGGDERARAREADLLRFQIAEIADAGVEDPTEDDVLRADEEVLGDASGIRDALTAAYAVVEDGALDELGVAVAALSDRPLLAPLHDRVRAAQAELAELARDLREAADGIPDDPERLEIVRTRRALLRQLRRKYGASLAEVLAYAAETQERLRQLEHHDEYAATLEARIAAAEARARAAATRLHDARVVAANPLAESVSGHLHELAMPRARMEVQIAVGDATDDGSDVVTFMLAANAGEPARPLARAASGGELARTMLALRLVSAGAPATLVFDEVDAGIGGEAGTAVGRRLADLAAQRQVLCVTHLAQVAAFADQHIVVEKATRSSRTLAHASVVDGDARVRELSRMLAGVEDSDHARRHAAELLAAAHDAPALASKLARAARAGRS